MKIKKRKKRPEYTSPYSCMHCRDTGHASGDLDDLNECGFCNTKPVPNPVPGSWEFTFVHDQIGRTFSRYNMVYEAALTDAKCGFQWTYGYWPSDPIRVKEIKPWG